MVSTTVLRRVLGWIMAGVLVVSVVGWYATRVPNEIKIATGEKGGQYYKLGEHLKDSLEARTGRHVIVEATRGSVDNADRLLSEEADRTVDLAILQGGAVSMDRLAVIAPYYPEVVHVIVRKGRGIRSIADLTDRTVVLGSPGSGMRKSARQILEHYGRPERQDDREGRYFNSLLEDPALDGAIVTSGMDNRDLKELLRTGEFDLLPIRLAKAISAFSIHFKEYEIPRGYYSASPPVPAESVTTVATTAFLATRADASPKLVTEVLASLYEEGLQLKFPLLIPRKDVLSWSPIPLHPVARRYFDPQDRVGWLANVMESLAATKELLFAFGAALYLLWDRWRRLKERERQALVKAEKEHLDAFLEETLQIEAAQMDTTDVKELQALLDDVTRIKLRALQELTHEELRGDRTFAIFLMQCANLINKVQMKIGAHASGSRQSDEGRSPRN
ncbi:MAG: TAXI family TRAP transporter solute-binding subunit [Phycisphaerales bacterium]|nr:MAG: TAXI family TRAP transporter solute-binding subunit [Phycisphaerales bacterium]